MHALAEKLSLYGYQEYAITMAKEGLSLTGDKYQLKNWIGDMVDDDSLALRANLEYFRDMPTLEGYLSLMELAGEEWEKIKPEVLKILDKCRDYETIAEVYIHEGQIDKAIKAVQKEPYNDHLLTKIADISIESHPDWVIRTSAKQAEKFIEQKKGKCYIDAARWLAKMKKACENSNQQKKWTTYFNKLKAKHKRKHSLMAKLNAL